MRFCREIVLPHLCDLSIGNRLLLPYRERVVDSAEGTVLEPAGVARLTELGRNRYSAAFRTHTGRWEPLPDVGSLDQLTEVVVTLLQPYLQSDNY